MRNANQTVPDHAAILATLSRSVPASARPAPGSVVRVTGTAEPGPAGPLRAPFSGRPCVWFRTVTVTYPAFGLYEWQNPSVGVPTLEALRTSDLGFPAYGDARVDDHESDAPLQVVGTHGGLLVEPTRADVDAQLVVDTAEGNFRHEPYTLRREWIIAPGTPVFALGPVSQGPVNPAPVMVADPANCVVLSTRDEATVVARSQGFVTAYPAAMAASRRRMRVAFGVGAAVAIAALIAVVLALAL